MNNETVKKKENKLIRDAASRELKHFCRYIDPKYELNWHHRVIANKLQEKKKEVENGERARLIIQTPPRHGKSDLASIKFPAWVLGHRSDFPIMTASYSADLASDFGRETKKLMQSENYKALFGTRLRKDQTAKAKWLTQGDGGYYSAGVRGSLTGKGFKIGIIDDPVKNREEAESELKRDKIWEWWKGPFVSRENGNGAIIVIMTRWHKDDLVGRLLSDEYDGNPDDWEVINFPAIAKQDTEHRQKGEALWQERFDLDVLEDRKKNAGPYEWSSLYQQEPVEAESREFKERWIKYKSWEKVDEKNTRKFATIDPGGKDEEQDFTGIVRNYVDARNNWYIKAHRAHLSPEEVIDQIFQLHDEGFEKIGIEETVYTQAIEPFLDKEKRKRDKFPNIESLKHAQREKEVRIRGLVPRYSSGSVYHIKEEVNNTNRCKDLERELRSFPKGAHDDTLDALAYQNDIAESPVDDVARALKSRQREEQKEQTKGRYGL